MARPPRPIDPRWPLADFASGLRALKQARGITYLQMTVLAHYCVATLSTAANGRQFPTLEVTLAYVRACGGPVEEWDRYWHKARGIIRDDDDDGAAADDDGDDGDGDDGDGGTDD